MPVDAVVSLESCLEDVFRFLVEHVMLTRTKKDVELPTILRWANTPRLASWALSIRHLATTENVMLTRTKKDVELPPILLWANTTVG